MIEERVAKTLSRDRGEQIFDVTSIFGMCAEMCCVAL